MPPFVSLRVSIRWIPDEPSEPTDTVVLIGEKDGVFLDVRFIKDSNELDWAFAGYRSVVAVEGKELTKFTHLIDSRTKDQVVDYGSNTELPDGTTLEKGEMLNPATGKITPYEEVWKDETFDIGGALFLRNVSSTSWYARVGVWQLALGRDSVGKFWAFQARLSENWTIMHTTSSVSALLPEDTTDWVEGEEVHWNDDRWLILEKA